MRHIKKFENYNLPEEVLVGQVWFGGHYDYEYAEDYDESDKYYIVVTEIDEEFEIIRYKNLSNKHKSSDLLGSFIERFEFICDSEDQLDLVVRSKKYNV